ERRNKMHFHSSELLIRLRPVGVHHLTMTRGTRFDVRVEGAVAHLRMVRVEARNAIDSQLIDELEAAVTSLENDLSVRAVFIGAAGPAFCVGGDLKFYEDSLNTLGEITRLAAQWQATLGRLAALPVPIVAAVQGSACGGGIGLALCADYTVASDDA